MFENSLKVMKVNKKSYFGGGDALNGNTTKLLYKDVLQKKFTILDCFIDDPECYTKFKRVWEIISDIHEGLKKPNKTELENKNLAKKCEEFGEVFPVYFERNLTRKMHSLTITVPHFLRMKSKFVYKISKVEQIGEKLHKDFNDLENSYKNIVDKPMKSFLKIRKYEVDNSTEKVCIPKFERTKINFG